MDILIKNLAEIHTRDENNNILKNAYIIIEDNKIKETGLIEDLNENKNKFKKIIDGNNMIALPGFINCHTHAAMTLLRGYADDLPLKNWLEDKIWPLESKLTKEDIYWGTILAIIEMIKCGTTTFCDMYFEMDFTAKAVEETGIRAVLSQGLIEKKDGEKGLKKAKEFTIKWNKKADNRITTMLAPHSPYTCTPDYLCDIIDISEELNVALNIHVAETKEEINIIKNKYQRTPVKHLEKIGVFNRPTVAAHCVYVNEEDINILKKTNTGVAYNPMSNMKLGSGIAPIKQMIKEGINVGFGTDGVASNNNLDIIEEAKIGSYLQKVDNLDPTTLNLDQIVEMLTVNGSRIFNLDKIGVIKKGYYADLNLIDCQKKVSCYPRYNNLSNIFYAGNGALVDTVIVNGKILMEKQNILFVDQDKVFSEINKRAKRIQNK